MTPLDDRVLVEVEAAAEKTAGGLYIPNTAQEKPAQGKIVAAGRGHLSKKGRLRPLDVKVGDTVMFGSFAGQKIDLEGRELVILREAELLGVVK